MPPPKPPVLAIIVPCYNEQELLNESISTLTNILQELTRHKKISPRSYICCVDDGSDDATWEIIEQQATTPTVKGVRLMRNYGHQLALLAGLMSVKDQCDCAITIDVDLQQDPARIPDFIAEYVKGIHIVYGVRVDRSADTISKRVTAGFFYSYLRFFQIPMVRRHADYRLLSNEAIIALDQYRETNVYLRGIIPLIGLPSSYIPYTHHLIKGRISRYTFSKMLHLGFDGITSFSTRPLRLISILGILIFFGSLVMSAVTLYTTLIRRDTVPGWASTVLPVYVLGGLQIFFLGVIGEYIGRVYGEVKQRPRYLVREKTWKEK